MTLSCCGLQNDCSVSIVHIGESAVDTTTEADSKDITETQYIDKPGTGMSGFL